MTRHSVKHNDKVHLRISKSKSEVNEFSTQHSVCGVSSLLPSATDLQLVHRPHKETVKTDFLPGSTGSSVEAHPAL